MPRAELFAAAAARGPATLLLLLLAQLLLAVRVGDAQSDERCLNPPCANQPSCERINATGRTYVTGNVVDGQSTIRFAVGQATTTRAHVFAAWKHIGEVAAAMPIGPG